MISNKTIWRLTSSYVFHGLGFSIPGYKHTRYESDGHRALVERPDTCVQTYFRIYGIVNQEMCSTDISCRLLATHTLIARKAGLGKLIDKVWQRTWFTMHDQPFWTGNCAKTDKPNLLPYPVLHESSEPIVSRSVFQHSATLSMVRAECQGYAHQNPASTWRHVK